MKPTLKQTENKIHNGGGMDNICTVAVEGCGKFLIVYRGGNQLWKITIERKYHEEAF